MLKPHLSNINQHLLIAPEGIEIGKPKHRWSYTRMLLIAPEGIEISSFS